MEYVAQVDRGRKTVVVWVTRARGNKPPLRLTEHFTAASLDETLRVLSSSDCTAAIGESGDHFVLEYQDEEAAQADVASVTTLAVSRLVPKA